jgi:Ca2+:H+ antiporter
MTSLRQQFSHLPKMAVLMLLFPVALVMHLQHTKGLPLFIVSALGILGTVTLIGKATEEVALYVGPVWGGLLNATFGNVTELIIAFIALKAGMHDIVRSSITGSILGNLLLVLGAAMLYGGLKHQTQTFTKVGAQANVSMLWLAVIALLVPTLVDLVAANDPDFAGAVSERFTEQISLVAAIILLLIYLFSLVFSLRTHRFLLMPTDEDHEPPQWSKAFSASCLLAATVVVALLSEYFVGAMEHMLVEGGVQMSRIFVGVIIVAVVGNAAEGSVAIWVARDNKMDLSFQIAMGSCLQVALLVAPVLVIASFWMGNPMTLSFNLFELVALFAAVLVASAALNDGESNWLEGLMFVALYVFFAVVFWFHP